jgi:hypothetical protein
MQPQFLVTVDTEEEGLWNNTFRARGNTVTNLRGIERFQRLCDAQGILPTYLVDTPVVLDSYGAELLGALQREGRAEVGAHLHPWCAPPFEEELTPRNSYLCNLPDALKRAKLEGLTELIAERFGRAPTSFRAGRYGIDLASAKLLAELGYCVDSSVLPFTDHSEQGGPRFHEAPWLPYLISPANLLTPDPKGFLLEVPVSAGFSRVNFAAASRWLRWASGPVGKRLRMVGVVHRLGLARRVKMSPEQATASQMKRLIDAFLQHRAPCVVLMFHSSSLVPGMSPYVSDAASLERFYAAMEEVFEYACRGRQMRANSLTGFATSSQTLFATPAAAVSG